MSMLRPIRRQTAIAVAVAILPVLLFAAPAGARVDRIGGSFGAGYVDPIVTLIHLLGFLAIGLWAGQQGGKAVWQMPASALVAALVAGFAGYFGVALPFVQEGRDASLVVLGGLVALAVRAPLAVAVVVAAVAAVFHGYGRAGAAGAQATPALYWTGFAVGLMLVQAAGVGLSGLVVQALSARMLRIAGGVIAVTGVLLFLDLL